VDVVRVHVCIDLLHLDPDGRRLGAVIPGFDLIVQHCAIVIDEANIRPTGLGLREVDVSRG
jgi:hypothetical protein